MSYEIEYCTETDGRTWGPYELQKVIVNSLYYAAKATVSALRVLGEVVSVFLPSGVRLILLDAYEVPDFRWADKTFYAIKVGFGKPMWYSFNIRLPKHGEIKKWWQALVAEKDIYIGTGEFMLFQDDDGNWKKGTDFDPVKRYGLLTHGIFDAGTILLFTSVGYILYKTGLAKTAYNFLQNVLGGVYKVTRIQKSISQSQFVDDVSDMMFTDFAQFSDRLDVLSTQMGVKLTIGR